MYYGSSRYSQIRGNSINIVLRLFGDLETSLHVYRVYRRVSGVHMGAHRLTDGAYLNGTRGGRYEPHPTVDQIVQYYTTSILKPSLQNYKNPRGTPHIETFLGLVRIITIFSR